MTQGLDLSTDVRGLDADVSKQGTLAATLRRRGGAVEFRYETDYLASGLPVVATTLPFTEEPSVGRGEGAVPAYFAGLLPEGRRLSGLRRAVKPSADDELSLLLAVGLDPVGDVQVVPDGQHPQVADPLISAPHAWSPRGTSSVRSSLPG